MLRFSMSERFLDVTVTVLAKAIIVGHGSWTLRVHPQFESSRSKPGSRTARQWVMPRSKLIRMTVWIRQESSNSNIHTAGRTRQRRYPRELHRLRGEEARRLV